MRPLSVRPVIVPTRNATWLIPSENPSSFCGVASVMIAALFVNMIPEPSPWRPRQAIIIVGFTERLVRREPTVKRANPLEYLFTLPTLSAIRPFSKGATVLARAYALEYQIAFLPYAPRP